MAEQEEKGESSMNERHAQFSFHCQLKYPAYPAGALQFGFRDLDSATGELRSVTSLPTLQVLGKFRTLHDRHRGVWGFEQCTGDLATIGHMHFRHGSKRLIDRIRDQVATRRVSN